jgi:tetratricopeptide (TPR) repeat protein
MNYGFTCFPRSAILIMTILCLLASADEFQQNAESVPNPALQTSGQTEADRLDDQVVQLLKENKPKEALPLAKRALELREKSVGPEHKLTVVALQNLGEVYSRLNKPSDGAKCYRRVLKIQEKLYGKSNAVLCDTLSKLGGALSAEYNSDAALEMFNRGLKLSEAAFGADAEETVRALYDLANLYRGNDDNKSFSYFQRVLKVREKQLGKNHPHVAALLLICARVLRQANRKAEADDYEARGRKIYSTLSSGAEPQMISPEMLRRAAIVRVPPIYPASAKKNRVQVEVRLTIDEAGIVTEAVAVSGPSELRNVSEKAASQWRFKPLMVNGRPEKVWGILTFRFGL